MADIPRVDAFPMTCPSCAAKAGFPFRATTMHDGIEIALRCHACHYEWRAMMDRAEPEKTLHSVGPP